MSNTNGGMVAGFTVGPGGGLSITNAKSASDLEGPSQTYNLTVGWFGGSWSFDQNGHFVINAGFSKGWGISFSEYPTYSTIVAH
jgi:hypothetical protein